MVKKTSPLKKAKKFLVTDKKIVSEIKLVKITGRLKKNGKKIVLCHGVFDIIHPGHVRFFEAAKKYGDVLIVTTNADRYVEKGPGRPVFRQELRAEVIASLSVVDFVAVINSPNAVEAISKLQPDYFVKGPDARKRRAVAGADPHLEAEKSAVEKVGGKLVFTEDNVTFSTSKILTDYYDLYPREMKDYLERIRGSITPELVLNTITKLKALKILVIGDTIIDQYHYCLPLGKSYKEPHLVQQYVSEESFIGGVLATANHCAALSDNITVVTMLGKKKSFKSFITKKLSPAVSPVFFFLPDQPTIIKRRFLDLNTKQKMFQISYLKENFELPEKLEQQIVKHLTGELPKYDLVICNDFGHGLISPAIVKTLVRHAKFLALNVQANSANFGFNVITKFPRADYVCIDKQEIQLAMQNKKAGVETLMKSVYKKMHPKMMLVTQGPHGTLCVSGDDDVTKAPALSSKVVDRVGAGDALFAITAPFVAVGCGPELVSFMGNVAGALKVQIVGNRKQIEYRELERFIIRLLR